MMSKQTENCSELDILNPAETHRVHVSINILRQAKIYYE